MKFLENLRILLHGASPELRRRLFIMAGILLVMNLGVWAVTLVVAHRYAMLVGLVALSYGLGLRHAVDADHIAAIDNTTRKLMQDGKRSVAVGFFFSLGHSTIVLVLCILIAISASFIKTNLPFFEQTGSVIGTTISSLFLLTIGVVNLMTFIDIFKVWRLVTKNKKFDPHLLHDHTHTLGLLTKLFGPFLKSVSHSWNMYFVGLLFGLGFDTASEVGLLSISAATGAAGMPVWYVLLLPIAFTAGMSLIDTLDGILMLGAYGWAYIKPVRKIYYNLNITLISVIIALFIGSVEAIQIVSQKFHLTGVIIKIVDGIKLESFGYIIIVMFVISWVVSIAFYKFRGYDKLNYDTPTK